VGGSVGVFLVATVGPIEHDIDDVDWNPGARSPMRATHRGAPIFLANVHEVAVGTHGAGRED
jgi:hypothetical protein